MRKKSAGLTKGGKNLEKIYDGGRGSETGGRTLETGRFQKEGRPKQKKKNMGTRYVEH